MEDEWPTTRWGALVWDGFCLLFMLGVVIVGHASIASKRRALGTNGWVVQYKRFWFWHCGHVKYILGPTGSITIQKSTLICCCCMSGPRGRTFDSAEVLPLQVHRMPLDCGEFLINFLAGCLVGIFVHFIPCIWWTCDWGPGDNEGTRGAIWFGLWAAGAIVFSFSIFRQRAIKIGLEYFPIDDQTLTELPTRLRQPVAKASHDTSSYSTTSKGSTSQTVTVYSSTHSSSDTGSSYHSVPDV